MNKIIGALVMTLVMTCGLGSAGCMAANGDEPSSWAKTQVEEAIQANIVPERLQGEYSKTITRGEFASLFVQAVFAWQKSHGNGISRKEFLKAVDIKDYSFIDAPSEDIRLAYALGFVNGTSPTTFSPDDPITRQEAAVMLINYFQLSIHFNYSGYEIGDIPFAAGWAEDAVTLAYHLKFFDGIRSARYGETGRLVQRALVDPRGSFTREQAILVAYRMFKRPDMEIRLRGFIPFPGALMKYQFEVSKDKVTLVQAFDASANQAYYAKLPYPEGEYPTERLGMDTMRTINEAKGILIPGTYSEELYKTLAMGENAVFDLGWGTYEILNPHFLFQYVVHADAGIHNYNYYGGAEQKPSIFTRIQPSP